MKTVATGTFKNPWEAWTVTVKENGVLALWKGLGAEIPRGIAMNSAMMTTRELMQPVNARLFG